VSIRSCRPLPKDREDQANDATGQPRSVVRHATTIWGTLGALPADLIDKAVNRLGMFGLLSAVAHPFLHFGMRVVVPAEILRATPLPATFMSAMWVAMAAGVAIYALTRSRKLKPGLMLDIGLIFEVVGAFCIGLMDAPRFSADALVNPGPAGIALWITFFVLVVPNTLGKTALATFSSALMGPLALIVAAYVDNQAPPAPFVFLIMSLPNLMSAVIAIILSRFVYSLGADVSNAREMGSYKLVELLGRGGMGEVWRAQHRLLARPAAIKLIQPEVLGCSDPRGTEIVKRRFEREAQATAMLSSPHTIDLYDFGLSEDGTFYYVMEMLRGLDLQTLVEKYGPVPAERTGYFLRQICSSLAEAHQSGLVHRDIKPANIYICRYGLEYDFIKVLDFGIVKSREERAGQSQLTNTGGTTGTPGFMAPEIALGKEIDARTDIYALGCVAYWLLTGRLVFEEETSIATILAHASKIPVPPSRRSEIEIPRELEDLILSCLEKEPQLRPSSAGGILKTLSQYGLAGSWSSERAENWWKKHMPEKTTAGTHREAQEDELQANAQAN
jgi:eukaryotic-like serine/threonine-protein kinase